MQPGHDRLAAINGLRALAILGVVWHHTVYKLWLQSDAASTSHFLWPPVSALLNSGWLGVNLFFVLSGFVLYLPFAAGRRDAESKTEWLAFYKRRALRLLPLFYLSLLVFTLIDAATGRPIADPRQLAAYLTLTFNFFTDTFFPQSNWVLWSLGVEIWFSLLFPLIVLAIRRYGITQVLIATILLGLLMRFVGTRPELFATGDRLNPIKDGILGRLDDFIVGVWICDAYIRERLKSSHRGPVISVGITVGICSCVGWERVLDGSASADLVPFLHTGIQLGCAALLVVALATTHKWVKALTNWPMQLIGMMCFSIYVWHGRLIEALLLPNFGPLEFCAYLGLLLSIAGLSYRFIEFPGVKPWRQLFTPMPVVNQSR